MKLQRPSDISEQLLVQVMDSPNDKLESSEGTDLFKGSNAMSSLCKQLMFTDEKVLTLKESMVVENSNQNDVLHSHQELE